MLTPSTVNLDAKASLHGSLSGHLLYLCMYYLQLFFVRCGFWSQGGSSFTSIFFSYASLLWLKRILEVERNYRIDFYTLLALRWIHRQCLRLFWWHVPAAYAISASNSYKMLFDMFLFLTIKVYANYVAVRGLWSKGLIDFARSPYELTIKSIKRNIKSII